MVVGQGSSLWLGLVASGWVIFKLDIAPPDWVENGGDSVGYNYANCHESGGNGERERETEMSIYSIIANVTLSWTSLSGLSLGTRSFEHGAAAQGEACLKVWQN